MKDVQQKTCSAGVQTVFTMLLRRSQFLVKNFTNNQITVKLGDNDSYSVIGAGSSERVFNNIEDVEQVKQQTLLKLQRQKMDSLKLQVLIFR